MKNRLFNYIAVLGVSLQTFVLSAQTEDLVTETANSSWITQFSLSEILLFFIVLSILLAVFVMYSIIMKLLREVRVSYLEKEGNLESFLDAEANKPSMWDGFIKKMNDAVPIEEEESIELSHDYDGIRELDNKLPPWWLAMFYLTIIFSIGYLFHYHILKTGPLQEQAYEMEMEEAEIAKLAFLEKQSNSVDERNVIYLSDMAAINTGKDIFIKNCVACHGANGEGNAIGPNLTDEYWLQGGGIKNVFSTIKYGVQEKGMISWKDQIRPPDMQKVASFIWSLQGTNPPGAKEQQGDKWIPEEVEDKDATSEDDNTTASVN